MEKKLNILWIMADELRTDALSCYGAREPRMSTPAIDAIAERGTLFERCYAASPICVPARAAMLSGLSPVTSGVLANEAYDEPSKLPEMFTETLAREGWYTANFGKEHLPGAEIPWQENVEDGSHMADLLSEAAEAGSEVRRVPGMNHVYSAPLPSAHQFSSELVTSNAVNAIHNSKEPFVIRASYLQPHRPAVIPEPWASKYSSIEFEVDSSPEHAPNKFEQVFGHLNRGRELSKEEMSRALQMYYGAVAWLDDQVAVLMSALQTAGLTETTVVVVSTDHGANVGEFGGFGKHTFAPASHRIPLVIAAPGQPGGHRRSDLATSEDLAATLLGLLEVSPRHQLDGRDLFVDPGPTFISSAIGYGMDWSRAFPNRDAGTWSDGRGWPQRACIRTQRYRLDGNTRIDGQKVDLDSSDSDLFLADLESDPGEMRNLIDDPGYEEVRVDLLALLRDVQRRLMTSETVSSRVAPSDKFRM